MAWHRPTLDRALELVRRKAGCGYTAEGLLAAITEDLTALQEAAPHTHDSTVLRMAGNIAGPMMAEAFRIGCSGVSVHSRDLIEELSVDMAQRLVRRVEHGPHGGSI